MSTASDLAKFYQFHIDRGKAGEVQVIAPETLRQLYVPQLAAGRYAMGFSAPKPKGDAGLIIRHGGATGTLGWVDLKRKIIFIGLTQGGSASAKPFLGKSTKAVIEEGTVGD